MAKINLSFDQFEGLMAQRNSINHELNGINSLGSSNENSGFKQDRKEQLEAEKQKIMEIIYNSVKKIESQQSPKIALPDFLQSEAEIVFFLYEKWNRLANENNEEYKEYYRAFVEREKKLSAQERAEFEKIRYNEWTRDFLRQTVR